MQQAAESLRTLSEAEIGTSDGSLAIALRALNRANLAQPNLWWVLYNRGIVFHRQGNDRAASRELTAALKVLQPHLNLPTAGCTEYEAAIHTHYALGHTLARSSQEEPVDISIRRRGEAVGHLRESAKAVNSLWEKCRNSYPDATTPLALFTLRPTGLSTAHLSNDLVTSYLAAPQYHDCLEKPHQEPSCVNLDKLLEGSCEYRDRAFCRSFNRAAAPFGTPFNELFHRFYHGDPISWGEEYRLWALSNAVDRVADNVDIDDAYLLYNFGALLLQVGEFQGAADYLQRAYGAAANSLPDEGLKRIARLTAVSNVLAGRKPGVGGGKGEPSSIRILYKRLYKDGDSLPVQEFPPVGSTFEPNAEAMLDNWLFLQLWRRLLQDGDFERFIQEYERLKSENGVFVDFFQRWRQEILTRFGERALERAILWEKSGQSDKAQLIRLFLSDSGQFPWAIETQARRDAEGWAAWGWRQAWPWLAGLILLLAPTIYFLRSHRLVRAYRDTFFSAYRQGRLNGFDNAYPRRAAP